jgi:hypothetical protein
MSDQTNEQTTLIREDGTQYVVEPFKLSKTKEIADRFRGEHIINIALPVAVPGDLDATIRNLRAFVSPEADFGEVLVAKFNGQGLRLDAQKEVKEFLSPENLDTEEEGVKLRDIDVPDMLGRAQLIADGFKLGAPRTRKGGGKTSGKVAQAEAKAAKVASTAVSMYRELPLALRQTYRGQLIEMGAATEAELDAVDQETGAEERPTGRGKR